MAQRYDAYKAKNSNAFRLILREGATFPAVPGANAADWEKTSTLEEHQMSDYDRAQIAAKGYSLTKLVVTFTEVVGKPPG